MRWHKEAKGDSEDSDIMSHLVDDKDWQALDHFDPEFARGPRVLVLVCLQMVSKHTTPIVAHTLLGQFSSCHTISL
jgi:hypothetical protein